MNKKSRFNIIPIILAIVLFPLTMLLGVFIGNGTLTAHFWGWVLLWILCMAVWSSSFCCAINAISKENKFS